MCQVLQALNTTLLFKNKGIQIIPTSNTNRKWTAEEGDRQRTLDSNSC